MHEVFVAYKHVPSLSIHLKMRVALSYFIELEHNSCAGPLEKTTQDYVNHEIKMLKKIGYAMRPSSF